jgi:hypothetical protein
MTRNQYAGATLGVWFVTFGLASVMGATAGHDWVMCVLVSALAYAGFVLGFVHGSGMPSE